LGFSNVISKTIRNHNFCPDPNLANKIGSPKAIPANRSNSPHPLPCLEVGSGGVLVSILEDSLVRSCCARCACRRWVRSRRCANSPLVLSFRIFVGHRICCYRCKTQSSRPTKQRFPAHCHIWWLPGGPDYLLQSKACNRPVITTRSRLV